jgi:transcriptional regulator with XRE-family HTH domain
VDKVQPGFGIRIKKLRLDMDMSQLDLAERVELSEEQISNIERGKSWTGEISFSLLANALGVSQKSLFDFSENVAFVNGGGLRRRASRKKPKLIVTRKRNT